MPQVTVIVPAYKREDDLRQALQSLAIQSNQDFNVIVSDDHSPQSLEPICNEFKNELNITYICTPSNYGCGGNRKFALDYFLKSAQTEYLMWLDSDDSLMPQAIDRLNKIILNNEADIISTQILQETDALEPKIIEAENRTWLHGKIYRSQFIKEHNITFPTTFKTNEDLAFNLAFYAFADELNIYNVNEIFYFWRNNQNSITRSIESENIRYQCLSIDYIEAIYFAFQYQGDERMHMHLINTIFNCYEYYQIAKIVGALKEKHKVHMRKMLKHSAVTNALVHLYQYKEISVKYRQWFIKGNSLVFFGQTFGQWIMEFFTEREIQQLITEAGLRE